MTVFGLVRSAVGNDESARSKYLGPTGKRSAGKLACSVWSGGKAVRPYLSLFEAILCSAPRRQLKRNTLGAYYRAMHRYTITVHGAILQALMLLYDHTSIRGLAANRASLRSSAFDESDGGDL